MEHLHRFCLNHAAREAVARCPACREFFCRECITEHEDRVLCASCLRKIRPAAGTRRRSLAGVRRLLAALAGLCAAWVFFYWVGQVLLAIPAEFHNGSVWKVTFWEE